MVVRKMFLLGVQIYTLAYFRLMELASRGLMS